MSPGLSPAAKAGLRRGESLARAWLNARLAEETAAGVVIDLGSGGSSSIARMRGGGARQAVTLDRRFSARPRVVGDCGRQLPFRAGRADLVLALNLVEHLAEPQPLISECHRLLRTGGRLIAYSPFLYPRHTAGEGRERVEDFLRPGPETWRRWLRAAGFTSEQIETCGAGAFTAAGSCAAAALPWPWLRGAVQLGGWLLDQARHAVRPPAAGTEWPLAYWIMAVK